jgi:N-methylhydantoinase A
MTYRIGVDIGGTFTDFCVLDEESRSLLSVKVLSTPKSPGVDVANGLRALRERFAVAPPDIGYFAHGQTVGVNTVIQRNGARLALLVTQNFRDILELERLRLPEIFNLRCVRPAPLVSRDRVLPIPERIRSDGTIKIPLDEAAVREAIKKAKSLDCDGIIVSLLNAYRNPEHERRAVEIVREAAPEMFVFAGSEIWPVIREFERTITAVLNGYVHPKVERYLTSLEAALKEQGVPAEPLIAKSNGGVMRVESGKTACAQVMLSGTAMGVLGANYVAQLCKESKVLSLDMGGTSVDVALISDATPRHGVGERIGDFQLFIPSVSVSSIGAGGGSIASVDAYGSLRVGPESAGSDPGPACYGKGGPPTLTDAFLMCGLLSEETLGYGAVTLHADRARSAIETIAGKIGRSIEGAAQAIIDVAVSGMYLEFGKLTSKHGIDPRELVLLPFGGAGPMIACFVARELGIRRLIIPTAPGVLSALGCLVSDVKNDFIRSLMLPLDAGALRMVRARFDELAVEAHKWFRKEGHFSMPFELRYSADMRYLGQKYEIEVPLDEAVLGDAAEVLANFHRCHQEVFDYHDLAAPVEIVNIRLVIVGLNSKPEIRTIEASARMPAPIAVKSVNYDGVARSAPVLRRADLTAGCRFAGPAIVVQEDTTTCVLHDFDVHVDAYGHLIIESRA